jgi:hypothetical protein
MGRTTTTGEIVTDAEWISPVFGDITAKVKLAAELEIERLLRLGLPVVVDRGNGIEDLTTWLAADGPIA